MITSSTRNPMGGAAARATITRTPSTMPVLRRPGLAVLALGFFALGYGFNHMKTTMRNNELAQKEQRNFYVSVDRSGGGI